MKIEAIKIRGRIRGRKGRVPKKSTKEPVVKRMKKEISKKMIINRIAKILHPNFNPILNAVFLSN
jgi:hypothetical protein